MVTQDGGHKILFKKATSLEHLLSRIRSPEVKAASEELLEVINALKESRDEILKAFNTMLRKIPKSDQVLNSVNASGISVTTQTEISNGGTEPHTTDVNLRDQDLEAKPPRRRKRAKQRHQRQQQPQQSQSQHTQPQPPDPNLGPEVEADWSTVRGKKSRRDVPQRQTTTSGKSSAEALVRKRIPKAEAVTISNPKEGISYADVMKKVMSEVNLQEIGVEVNNTRRTKAGGILLEIKDKAGADLLAERLKSAIDDQACISRPSRTTQILVVNIADWLEEGRVIDDIRRADERLQSATIVVRNNSGGGRVAAVKVSMATALRLSAAGAIWVGMGNCRVKLLENRKARCYRCDGLGHMARSCTAASAVRKCFRCHRAGHLIADCTGALKRASDLSSASLQPVVGKTSPSGAVHPPA